MFKGIRHEYITLETSNNVYDN